RVLCCRTTRLVRVVRKPPAQLSRRVLYFSGTWNLSQGPGRACACWGYHFSFCCRTARLACNFAHALDPRRRPLFGGDVALVHRRATAQSGVFSVLHSGTQFRALLHGRLSPPAALLVLPARFFAGYHALDNCVPPRRRRTRSADLVPRQGSFLQFRRFLGAVSSSLDVCAYLVFQRLAV